MKKFIITLSAFIITSMPFSVTAYAAENLDRDYIEAEIWDDMWNGKGDNGIDFPEASYKHHLLDKWLDENYGSEEYDWSKLGELKYEYKDYYRDYIEDFDFEDDDNEEARQAFYDCTFYKEEWFIDKVDVYDEVLGKTVKRDLSQRLILDRKSVV